MRTNVVIDDALMDEALRVSQFPTKRSVIEAGLRALILLKAHEQIRSLRGKLHWEGDLIEHGLTLLHNDSDFDPFALHLGLKIAL